MSKKGNGKKIEYFSLVLAIVSSFIFLFTSVAAGYAWFRFGKTSPDTNVNTDGDLDDDIQYKCAYYHPTVVDGVEVGGEYIWKKFPNNVEWNNMKNLSNNSTSGDKEVLGFGESYSANKNLDLGTMDNISTVQDKNRMWFCFKVRSKKASKFNIKIKETDLPEFYAPAGPGLDISNTPLEDNESLDILRKNKETLMYHVGTSNKLLTNPVAYENNGANNSGNKVNPPTENEIVLDDTNKNNVSFKGEFNSNTSNPTADVGLNGVKPTIPAGAVESEFYYIYVRLQPNIIKLADFVNDLGYRMPCILSYKLEINISISD